MWVDVLNTTRPILILNSNVYVYTNMTNWSKNILKVNIKLFGSLSQHIIVLIEHERGRKKYNN